MNLKTRILVFTLSMTCFQASSTEPIWDANKVTLESEKLGEGVFAIYPSHSQELNSKGGAAATSGGLIVGKKGVLMIETMINKHLHQQMQELNKKLTGKNIMYAVNTSSHGDHSFGNMYLSKNTLIIQHENTRNYIASHLEDDKNFMLQNFGKGRGIEVIKLRSADIMIAPQSKLILDLGGKTVQIIDFGFAQTGGDLWIWEPQSKIMWAGNPVIAAKPALPWLLDGHLVATLETLLKVYEFLPAEARIIPGHGRAINREGLKWHIDYLNAVKLNVQKAIAKGLSVEETVKQVTMPEYKGYVLFDWVHSGLNVPAAYKDLNK